MRLMPSAFLLSAQVPRVLGVVGLAHHEAQMGSSETSVLVELDVSTLLSLPSYSEVRVA